jgi:putative nucleotidyltransferase with HDIG domain
VVLVYFGADLYNANGIWVSTAAEDSKDLEKIERPATPAHLRLVATELDQDLSQYISIPIELLPMEVPLPYSVYVRIGAKLVKFRSLGNTLTHERASGLVKGRVDSVFITRIEWDSMLKAMEGYLAEAEKSTQMTIQQHGENVRSLLIAYQRDMEIRKTMEKALYDRFKMLAERLAQLVMAHPGVANTLIRRYQDHGLYSINHTINVAIYSISIAQKRAVPKSSLRLLSLAALTHNIGNIFIPKEILTKTSELTVREKLVIDSHVQLGAKLLTRLGAPQEVILTAQQHHDRMDGKSRPSGTTGPIHQFARIVAIADVFDAMTSPRPHQPIPLTPLKALERMRGMEGKFDPAILNAVGNTDGSDDKK